MDRMMWVVFCCALTLVPYIDAYPTGYSQTDANANFTPQLPQGPQQPAFNVPYPPKSAYNYPQLVPVQQPSVLYIDPQSQQSLYGADQSTSTTTAAPSGIWKIFSEFSLPNWFGRNPEETSTDYSTNPFGYQPPSPAPYPYSQPNDQSSYYNYAVFHQPSPSGAPSSGNYHYYQSYSKYPLYQVPAPGSKTPILPPAGRYPANYYNSYPYVPTAGSNPITSTPSSLLTSPIPYTTTTISPVPQYPSNSKPGYPQQPQPPAYSIYLVQSKPAYYPQNSQAQLNPSNQVNYNQYARPATYPVQEPPTYYNNYGSMGGYYSPSNKNPFYPVTAAAPVLTTTSKTPASDCNNTTTTTTATVVSSTPDIIPIDIRNNEKKDKNVDSGTTTITTPFTTTTTELTTTSTTTVGPTETTDSSTVGSAQARYLFSQEDQENNWVPLVPAV